MNMTSNPEIILSLVNLSETSAIVKTIGFFILWVGCWFPFAIITIIILNKLNRRSNSAKIDRKLPLLASLYAIAPLIIWKIGQLQGISLTDYGFSWNLSMIFSLVLGWILGILGLFLLFGVETALKWVTWNFSKSTPENNLNTAITTPPTLASIISPIFLLSLWIGGVEELIFRGFLLTQLQQDYSLWIAAIISSVIFAILHLVWEIQETLPQLLGLWLMGMVLVLARWFDRGNLGLAWGLHSAWIWIITCIDTAQLINYTGKTPEWITGLGKKPLAGVMGILFLLVTAGSIWQLKLVLTNF